MNKEFVPYEIALALKELGFDEPCLASYYHAGKTLDICEYIANGKYTVLAPLFQQAFRWFREKHGYHCFVTKSEIDGKWYYYREDLNDRKNDSEPELTPRFDTPEEAELACLKKLIEIVK
jgi:hypothetical protein